MRNFFAEIMKLVTRPDFRSNSVVTQAMHEEFADAQLLIGAQAQMAEKLNQYRQKGRYGWWREEVCTIDELYSYRKKALDDNDHTSVLIFTSMIAAREAHKDSL
ncbi:hypothetical protein [Vibrio parahaemolyticus]|uniref:hypothetical protein n=1 Tax=Vibrio parahaemolyticus TaxID=670 RepID=UPI0013B764BE|nr:hypothetical protein [Vibrio parahaemolyticus]MBY7719665.1 hypothetical protein [Vibrio parahaemolyticus]NEU19241.1 hypothetical protein [Vibrio parahaemolyticus]